MSPPRYSFFQRSGETWKLLRLDAYEVTGPLFDIEGMLIDHPSDQNVLLRVEGIPTRPILFSCVRTIFDRLVSLYDHRPSLVGRVHLEYLGNDDDWTAGVPAILRHPPGGLTAIEARRLMDDCE